MYAAQFLDSSSTVLVRVCEIGVFLLLNALATQSLCKIIGTGVPSVGRDHKSTLSARTRHDREDVSRLVRS